MTLARQVEQHRITITNIQRRIRRLPLSLVVATNDISVLDLKQGDGRPLVVTSIVEVFPLPSVFWTSIEHVSNELLVAEQFTQEFLLLILSRAFWIRQEVFDHCKYFAVSQFRFGSDHGGLRLGFRGFWLRDRVRLFDLRVWISFNFCFFIRGFYFRDLNSCLTLHHKIRNFRLRCWIWRFILRDGVRRLCVSIWFWGMDLSDLF